MTPLDSLMAIPDKAFGKRLCIGAHHFQLKYRIDDTPYNRNMVKILFNKYPYEMKVYFTKESGKIIFGGTFATSGNFYDDSKWLMRIREKIKTLVA